MTQNAKKDEPQNPVAAWWKTMEQTHQSAQDSTLKAITSLFETQRRFMRAMSRQSGQQD